MKEISVNIPRIHTSVIGHTQHCDVFFAKVPYTGAYNKPRLRPFFIFVDEATHQIVIYHSNSRSLVSFAQAIRCVNAFYSCNGHTQLQALYCDNEAAVRAYEEEFNLAGGLINFKGAGEHVALVERPMCLSTRATCSPAPLKLIRPPASLNSSS